MTVFTWKGEKDTIMTPMDYPLLQTLLTIWFDVWNHKQET
jgi:hypothetical protein